MRGVGVIGTVTLLVLACLPPPALAASTFFDIVPGAEPVSGPPYPTACHRARVAHEASGVFEADGSLAVGLRRATDGVGAPLGMSLLSLGGERPGEDFTDDTRFEVRCCDVTGGGTPSNATLELLFELTGVDGQPGKLMALHPEIPFPDPGRFFSLGSSDSSVEVTCRVQFARGVQHELELLGELPVGLHLNGASVVIVRPRADRERHTAPQEETEPFTATPDGFFDLRVGLSGDVAFVDQSQLLTLTLTGRFLGGTSPVEATTWGALKARCGD